MQHREESWKYDTQRSIFDERGVSSGDETLCGMLDITSQTKWFYKEKLRNQCKNEQFLSDFQTLIKHLFPLLIINEFEKVNV